MAARKVAIVGFATTSREQAPWHDPEFEIWACNAMGMHMPADRRVTRYFELHSDAVAGERLQWCAGQDAPVFMWRGPRWEKRSVSRIMRTTPERIGSPER